MALRDTDDEREKMGDEEKVKAIANPYITITAVILVPLVEYFYLASGLYWDPVVATIPLLAVAIPLGYYIDGKIQKIYTDRKEYSMPLWTMVFILIISSRVILVIEDYGIFPFNKKCTFLITMSLVMLALVLASIWIRKRAQESFQPSEDSYNTLLKHAIAVIVIDVTIIAGCFVFGTLYGAAASLLLFVLAVVMISLGYLVMKARSLGFIP